MDTKEIANFHANQMEVLAELIKSSFKKEVKSFHECTSDCRRNGCPNCEHGYDEEHIYPICDKDNHDCHLSGEDGCDCQKEERCYGDDGKYDLHKENPELLLTR